MYHRVAPAGVAVRDRYRVTPARFEEQLRHLRDSGYRSISFDQWRRATVRRRPLPGHVVALTFDDGYLDFRDFAWPLLRRYGFGATVFLVTGSIGRWNSWDGEDGQQEPLLDWEMVRRLQGEGVEFGAHSVSHRPMSLLSPEAIGREALGSRAAIERAIGARVTAFAYPYGDEDPVIQHLVGASGFVYGLTTRPWRARLDESLLILPRLEVCGDDDLSAFSAKLSEP
jgi:peptidoglycan/xylan/chitin deacetylase (PgdA/CDA1 family)